MLAGMTDSSGPPFRADHVGSLLRPQNLLDARAKHAAGEIDDAELREIEDEAIADVVRSQADVGLLVDVDIPWFPNDVQPKSDSFWAHIDIDILKPASPEKVKNMVTSVLARLEALRQGGAA